MADDAMAAVYANLSLRLLLWARACMAGVNAAPPLATAEIIAVGSELLGTDAARHQFAVPRRAPRFARDRAAGKSRRRRRARATRGRLRGRAVARRSRRAHGRSRTDRRRPDARRRRRRRSGCAARGSGHRRRRSQSRFARRGLRMPEVNRRQAMVPRGAVSLDNPNGTAPGLYIEHRGPCRRPAARPAARTAADVRRALCADRCWRAPGRSGCSGVTVRRRPRRVPCRGDRTAALFAVGRRIAADRDDDPRDARSGRTAPDASGARCRERARRACVRAREELAAALGDDVFSTDGRSMEEVVGAHARATCTDDRDRRVVHRRPA